MTRRKRGEIKEEEDNYMVIDLESKVNKSYSFVLPMVFNTISDVSTGRVLSKGLPTDLINVYIGDKDYPDLKRHLFLLYQKNDSKNYEEFNVRMINKLQYYMDYDVEYNNKIYQMYVFQIPDSCIHLYELFIEGRYSDFDDVYKQHILTFFRVSSKDVIGDILYKREKHFELLEEIYDLDIPRDQECMSKPNLKFEIFRNISLKYYFESSEFYCTNKFI